MKVLLFVCEEEYGALPTEVYGELAAKMVQKGHQVFISLPFHLPQLTLKGVKQKNRIKRHLNTFPHWLQIAWKNFLAKYIHPKYPIHHKAEIDFQPQLVIVFNSAFIDNEFFKGSWLFNIFKEKGSKLYKVCCYASQFGSKYSNEQIDQTLVTLEHWNDILFSSNEVWKSNERLIAKTIRGSLFDLKFKYKIEKIKTLPFDAVKIYCPLPVNLSLHGQDQLVQYCSGSSKKISLYFLKIGPDVEALKTYASSLGVSLHWLSPDDELVCQYLWLDTQLRGLECLMPDLYKSEIPLLNRSLLNNSLASSKWSYRIKSVGYANPIAVLTNL